MPHPLDMELAPIVGYILTAIGVQLAGTTQYSTVSDFLWSSDQDADIEDEAVALTALCARIRILGIEANPEDSIWTLAEKLKQYDGTKQT